MQSLIAGGGLLVLLAATPAAAQTADDAQDFLRRVAEQGASEVWRGWPGNLVGNDAYRNCAYGCNDTQWRGMALTTAASPETCVTVLTHRPPQAFSHMPGWNWTPSYAPTSARIVWSRVTSVSIAQGEGNRVQLAGGDWGDGMDAPSFTFDTTELAERVRTAMEFLRSSCDTLDGTGF